MVSTIEAAKCDWNVFIEMESDCKRLLPLKVRLIYNAVLFSRERMEEILVQLDDVAFQIASQPNMTYHDLNIRTERSAAFLPNPRAQLPNQFNGSAFLHFHQQALKNPEAPCVVETDKTYTYKEIDAASSKVAHFLIKEGIEKEDIVALYAHRSSAMVVAVMGILKAGATLTVVDPAYPPARQNIYLSVAKPRGIITLKAAVEPPQDVEDYIAKELDLKCRLDKLTTNADIDALSSCPPEYPGVEVSGDDVATLSFTSGSTGIPKGVRGRHISLTHFYPWMSEELALDPRTDSPCSPESPTTPSNETSSPLCSSVPPCTSPSPPTSEPLGGCLSGWGRQVVQSPILPLLWGSCLLLMRMRRCLL
jgi:non-ribosomal peptide synthetase component F